MLHGTVCIVPVAIDDLHHLSASRRSVPLTALATVRDLQILPRVQERATGGGKTVRVDDEILQSKNLSKL